MLLAQSLARSCMGANEPRPPTLHLLVPSRLHWRRLVFTATTILVQRQETGSPPLISVYHETLRNVGASGGCHSWPKLLTPTATASAADHSTGAYCLCDAGDAPREVPTAGPGLVTPAAWPWRTDIAPRQPGEPVRGEAPATA
eukprot:CAMPEP_0179278180 /NCGR_PEP_ID=MMETSP0797-20121207/35475_1 /TAXON_ID=47934 /ORGANISM="Dinophysis acuminata, Strain DAEP01" /LENGTH=142 /DNA_ID=CAMNT_0020986789 /DNA_START=63 /DNA_END=490 /DNA_ORIENTATION=+